MRLGRRGGQVRPFCARAQIAQRAYSLPLQRALVDFGADDSFLAATQKMREHYGVEVPLQAARQHTLAHAQVIGGLQCPPAPPAKMVITSMDGSMIPVVEAGLVQDKRKGKTLVWKQANLCCARSQEAVECVYGATMASVKMAGLTWREVAREAGLVASSWVHAVADGADPIFSAFCEQFAPWEQKARFTLDFYHAGEHLSAAAEMIAPDKKKEWLHRQRGRLLENKTAEALQQLEAHLEAPQQEPAPVRAAYHYLHKRKDNLDYAGARAQGLPIGSGEIESGHRHVIQQRLKIAGAWWTIQNAQSMLQLRTTRANHHWHRYWSQIAKN